MDAIDPKEQALRQSGTFNRRASRVRDLLFLEHAFFDARDLLQVKYEMLRRVIEGVSVSEAAERFGLSRPTYYKAQQAFEAEGLSGLIPERPGPRRAHKLTDERARILEVLLAQDPQLTWAELADALERQVGLRVHPRTIKRRLEARQKKR